MIRVCFVVASELTARAFLRPHLSSISQFANVSLAANADRKTFVVDSDLECPVLSVPIERRVSIPSDVAALWTLYGEFRRGSFDVVHSVTPKAGLLSMLAACLAGVPIRIHTFTGQVWATRVGLKRLVLKLADRATAALATDVLVDSHSQLKFLIDERVVAKTKASVLAHGSISGVDTDRFRPDTALKKTARQNLDFAYGQIVFLYLGRLNREKGLLALAEAFTRLAEVDQRVRLMVVGPDEDRMVPQMRMLLGEFAAQTRFAGYSDKPEQYIVAADVLCLPSLREGFGTVILEAAAAGVPAIGSRVYGIVDAIEDGVTGLLHEPRDVAGIHSAMATMAQDEKVRHRMGIAARERVERHFRSETLSAELARFYQDLLEDVKRNGQNA